MAAPNDPTAPGQSPKLHIDSDWKAQAQAEKERLSQREAERAHDREARSPRGGEGEEFPPADFRSLAGMIASQALGGLGAYADEQGRVIVDLAGSRFAIDLLAVLEEKTKGNLTPEEANEISSMLTQLRARFMQLATVVAQQMQARGAAGGADSMGGGMGGTLGGTLGGAVGLGSVAGRIDAGGATRGGQASPAPTSKKPTLEIP
jgi:hypothetical protein